MVSVYFGLPGCGKTTLMSKFAKNFVHGKKYNNVYGNVHLAIPGYIYIDNECIGKYEIVDGAVLIDEGVLFACNRNFKNFDMKMTSFFMEHRHANLDIYIFTQSCELIDKQIRSIIDHLYYITKPKLLGKWITKYYRIPYGIDFHNPKSDGYKYGDIVEGYAKPDLSTRIFGTKRIIRPLYYKYFNSWEREKLPPLPQRYQKYEDVKH